jgi:hypothetical protein
VLQQASDALDAVRRQDVFVPAPSCASTITRKRWMLLRRWNTVRGSKRTAVCRESACCSAYVLREQLDRLWTDRTRPGVLDFRLGWIQALRRQRLPGMQRLGDFTIDERCAV